MNYLPFCYQYNMLSSWNIQFRCEDNLVPTEIWKIMKGTAHLKHCTNLNLGKNKMTT